MYDVETGGGFDGLTPCGPSRNMGAESTLSYLTALMEMRLAEARTWSGRVTGVGYVR